MKNTPLFFLFPALLLFGFLVSPVLSDDAAEGISKGPNGPSPGIKVRESPQDERESSSKAFFQALEQWKLAQTTGNLERQVASLRQMMDLRPERAGEWLRHLSETYHHNGAIKESREVARDWIAFEPSNSQAYLHLANLYYLAGQRDKGHQTIQEALDLATDTIPLRRRLAEALLSEEREAEALETYWELFPELPSVSDRLRLIREMLYIYQRGDFPGSLDEWVTRQFPDHHETTEGRLFRGEFSLKKGYHQTARQELERARALEPENPGILDSLIYLALKKKAFEEAVRQGRDALTMENSAQNKIRLAYLLLHIDETEEALALIERHIGHFVSVPQKWPEFFEVLHLAGKPQKLVQMVQNHLPAMERPLAAKLGLAEYFISQGDLTAAEELLWEVYGQEPDEGFASYHLPSHSRQRLRESAEYGELRIPLRNLRRFAMRIVENHPILQRANEPFGDKRTFASDLPESLSEINALRSHALGYLLAIAVVKNQEGGFADRLNEYLATQPAHRILIEKLKVGQFDDLFIKTFQAVAEGEHLIPLQWEAPIYMKLDGYARREVWKQLPPKTHESIVTAMERWLQHHAKQAATIRSLGEAQDWETLLKGQSSLPDKEEVFQELDSLLEKLSHTPLFESRFHLRGIQIALAFDDFDLARERLHSFEPHPLTASREVLSQTLATLSQKNRPLKESEKHFLGDFLSLRNSLRRSVSTQPLPLGHFPTPIDRDALRLPFHLSQSYDSRQLSQFQQLHARQQEQGEMTWEFLFPTARGTEEPNPNLTPEEQTLKFFIALWNEDHATAKALGESFLDDFEDVGVRINLALLKEKEGNLREALTLLEGANMTHRPLFWVIQGKIIQLASTDKDWYPKGQEAVRRLVRDGDQRHRNNLPGSLKELHYLVGMEEEWEDQIRQQEEISKTSLTPSWYKLYEYWDSTEDPEEKQRVAKEILRESPIAYRETMIRQRASEFYPQNRMTRILWKAKKATIDYLYQSGGWDDFLASLRQKPEDAPDAPETLARLIEALEFSESENDPAPYYRKALALSPADALLREGFSHLLYERGKYDELVGLFRKEVAKNPYLVLRGDHPKLETAWHQTGNIPALVEDFLQRPALDLHLSRLSRGYGNLSRILKEVSTNLEDKGYPVEATRIRAMAIEKLPVHETLPARLDLLKKHTQEGDNDSARSLLLGFFENPGQNPANPFLFNGDPNFNQPVQGNWLDLLGPWAATHPRNLPYPLQLMQAAPEDVVAAYRDLWLERQPTFPQVGDPAEALLGTIIHWAIRHPDFPPSLIAVAELFGPGGNLPQEQQDWFQRSFYFPFLESLPYFSPDEKIQRTLYQAFEISPERVSEMREEGRLTLLNRNIPMNHYRSALLIKGMDRAWEYHEEIFQQIVENQGRMRPEEFNHFPSILREASNRLKMSDFAEVTQTLLNAPRTDKTTETIVQWEQERHRLSQGEVRRPYLAAYPISPSTPNKNESRWFYAISSTPDEPRRQNVIRHQRGFFYGEEFPLLDQKFDLIVTYSPAHNDSETSEIKIEEAPASKTIELPGAADRGRISFTLMDPDTGDTVFAMKNTNRRLTMGANILPPLYPRKGENDDAEGSWEWLGALPRKDPDTRFMGEKTVHFSGYGISDQEIARSPLLPLVDCSKIVNQGLVKTGFSPGNLFTLMFYNEQGEEIFAAPIRSGASLPRWSYNQSELYRASGDTVEEGQFPREATHVRMLIRSRSPLNIAHLSLELLP
ncbi:MAG: hypothetical protein LAT55_10875 [Opitutales bacterium]|nr:hypothetical protein [Opitutales bacterium]